MCVAMDIDMGELLVINEWSLQCQTDEGVKEKEPEVMYIIMWVGKCCWDDTCRPMSDISL